MALGYCEADKITKIANMVRTGTGKTDKMTLSQMPSEIANVSSSKTGNATVAKIYDGKEIFACFTEIDCKGWDISACVDLAGIFQNMTHLKKVDLSTWDTSKVTYGDGVYSSYEATGNTLFSNCTSLTTLILGPNWFSGVIYPTGTTKTRLFSLSSCPLTHDSCLDVFNKLADRTNSTSMTLKLSSTTKALMSDDEIKIATDKGWTVS